MRRRDFIGLISGTAAWPLAARAQQREPLRRVAILQSVTAETPGAQARYTAFLEAFKKLGWTDGRNVQIVVRWAGGDDVKARKYADELVALAPDVLVASGGGTATEVLLKATRTIPIVFVIAPDPVGRGGDPLWSRSGHRHAIVCYASSRDSSRALKSDATRLHAVSGCNGR